MVGGDDASASRDASYHVAVNRADAKCGRSEPYRVSGHAACRGHRAGSADSHKGCRAKADCLMGRADIEAQQGLGCCVEVGITGLVGGDGASADRNASDHAAADGADTCGS